MRGLIQLLLVTVLFVVTLSIDTFISYPERDPSSLETGDKEKCLVLLDALYKKNKGLLNDYERGTTYFYPGRTIRAFEASDPKDIARAFDPAQGGMSYADFQRIWWATKWGGIKVSGAEERFLDDLYHMVDDYGPFFWRDQDQVYNILETLRRADKKWDMIKGRNESAVSTKKALSLLDTHVVERALADHAGVKFANNTFWDYWSRFFFPHYKKVLKILDTTNSFRKRVDLAYWADEPFENALQTLYGNPRYAFNDADQSFFKRKIGDTGAEVADVRSDAKAIYGQEPTIERPMKKKDIKVKDIYQRLRQAEKDSKQEFTDEFDHLYSRSNADLDELDQKLYRAWTGDKSRKYNLYPMEDLDDSHLSIRHGHFAQLSHNKRARYYNFVQTQHPANADYEVKIRWTVTVHHSKTETRWTTDSEGKRVQESYTKTWTTSYTKSRVDTYQAYYDEVLKGHIDPDISDSPSLPAAIAIGMHADYATNGSARIVWEDSARQAQILSAGAQARASEAPYRDLINQAEQMIDDVLKRFESEVSVDPVKRSEAMANLKQMIDQLIARGEEITEYQASGARTVLSQWADDIPSDFTRRNDDLMNRIDHMIFRLRHTNEQLRRAHTNLGLNFELPEYNEALAQLRRIHIKYRVIQWTTGGIVTAGGGYVSYDLWRDSDDPYYHSKTKQLFHYLKDQVQHYRTKEKAE